MTVCIHLKITKYSCTTQIKDTTGKTYMFYIQGGPKKIWHTLCMPYNFIKYSPIFKLF